MQVNPFKPTAGKTPPAIIGRESVLEEFIEGMQNGPGAPGRLMRISGVRGTGKTVLLREVRDIARDLGWMTVDEIATEGLCTRILSRVTSSKHVKSAVVEASVLGISLGSVQVEHVGPSLRDAMSAAIRKNGHGLLITLDEVQDAALDEVRVLATTIQRLIGDDLDIAFVFAGLPSMIDGVINGKTLTFLRRAVPFELKAVDRGEVAFSLADTFSDSGIALDERAAAELADASRGYPFLIQLVGYHVWQQASRANADAVDATILERGILVAKERFMYSVVEPALQRVSPMAIAYLLAMAKDDGRSSDSGDIATRLGKTTRSLSVPRARLIRDSLIEAPSWGKVSFAIPYMADYLNEHREELEDMLAAG